MNAEIMLNTCELNDFCEISKTVANGCVILSINIYLINEKKFFDKRKK